MLCETDADCCEGFSCATLLGLEAVSRVVGCGVESERATEFLGVLGLCVRQNGTVKGPSATEAVLCVFVGDGIFSKSRAVGILLLCSRIY